MSDYATDTKSVLDQALRVLQAMVDIAADGGWLFTAIGTMHLTQMVTQARFLDDSQLSDLPFMNERCEQLLASHGIVYLPQLIMAQSQDVRRWLGNSMDARQLGELQAVLRSLPSIHMDVVQPDAKLAAGDESEIAITLRATNPVSRRAAYAPRFPKAKMAGWWLSMGVEDELLALKRVHLDRGTMTTTLQYLAPDEPGEHVFEVYLVSDSYIGLDQRHTVRILVAG